MVERKSSIIAWGAEDIPGTRRQKTSYTVRSLLPISKKFHKVDTLGSLPQQSLILSLHLSSISHFCHPTDYLFTSYTIYTGSSQKFFFLLSVNLLPGELIIVVVIIVIRWLLLIPNLFDLFIWLIWMYPQMSSKKILRTLVLRVG